MCLVGDKGVGKTSLIQFLKGESLNLEKIPNDSINQSFVVLSDSVHKQQFRVWDICGERIPCEFVELMDSIIFSICFIVLFAITDNHALLRY